MTKTEDPRILQGIALCYISKIYKIIKSEVLSAEIEGSIDLAIHYLRLAREKYQLLINRNYGQISDILIMKNYIAVLNSLSDMNLRKHDMYHPGDFTLTEIARQCIDEIKSLFDTIDLIYDDHPTYSATEFEIEYYEALHYYQSVEMSKAHQKIVNARARINLLKSIPNCDKYVDELFLQKESSLNDLELHMQKH